MRRRNKRDYRTYTKHSPRTERFLHFIRTVDVIYWIGELFGGIGIFGIMFLALIIKSLIC